MKFFVIMIAILGAVDVVVFKGANTSHLWRTVIAELHAFTAYSDSHTQIMPNS